MKSFLSSVALLVMFSVSAQLPPPPASVAETVAGTSRAKYVSPYALAQAGSSTNVMGTNIAVGAVNAALLNYADTNFWAAPATPLHLNLGNFPFLTQRFYTNLTPRILVLSDNALNDSGGRFVTAVMSNLDSALPLNGSMEGNSTIAYAAASVASVSPNAANALSPLGWYPLANGDSMTNRSTASRYANGIPSTRCVVGYWAGSGMGTWTLYTNACASGTYGARASIGVVNADDGAALHYVTTNFDTVLDSYFASIASSGTNVIDLLIGQYNTNKQAGYIFDAIGYAGMTWQQITTNSYHSNWLKGRMAWYDCLLVSDLGNPEIGASAAEGLFSTLTADLGYLGQPPTTNDAASSVNTRSNSMRMAIAYKRPFVDVAGWFPVNSTTALVPYYNADGTHLSRAGAAVAGNLVAQTLGWNFEGLRGLGYTNRYGGSGGSQDLSGYAVLSGGNDYSSGSQIIRGVTYHSNGVFAAKGGYVSFLDQGGGAGNKMMVSSNANSWVFWDSQGNFQWLTLSNNSGVLYLLPNDKGSKMMLGASWPNQRFDTGYFTNLDTLNLISSNVFVGNMSYATNISGTSPNFTNGSYQTLTTNNAFVWLPPSGINTYDTNVQTICIAVTNIAAAMTNMTAPANVHTKGTWWVTNVTKITWEYDPTIRSTNAYSLPLW